MSADLDTQHFGQPEEPGTPGVAKYRAARKALAAWKQLPSSSGKDVHRAAGEALAKALAALMPTYGVVEWVAGSSTPNVVATDFETREAAQHWIAAADPSGRRHLEIAVQKEQV